MKKTIMKVVAVLVVCVALVFAVRSFTKKDVEEGEKTITISIYDGDEEIGTIEEVTDGEYLSEVLLEMVDEEDIVLEYEDSDYGMFITGLGIDELIEQDESSSKYWTYTSENNRSCVDAGYCTGASELPVYDGDEFVFTLITY